MKNAAYEVMATSTASKMPIHNKRFAACQHVRPVREWPDTDVVACRGLDNPREGDSSGSSRAAVNQNEKNVACEEDLSRRSASSLSCVVACRGLVCMSRHGLRSRANKCPLGYSSGLANDVSKPPPHLRRLQDTNITIKHVKRGRLVHYSRGC